MPPHEGVRNIKGGTPCHSQQEQRSSREPILSGNRRDTFDERSDQSSEKLQPAEPLSWWKTVLSWFGGYKAEKKAWQNRLQNKQNALKKMEEMQEDRAKHIGENGQLDKDAAAGLFSV